jgi:hypothetical protein
MTDELGDRRDALEGFGGDVDRIELELERVVDERDERERRERVEDTGALQVGRPR